MDKTEIHGRYGRYGKALEKLSTYGLYEVPKVDVLMDNKSMMQGAYKEMRKTEFSGSLIDFLCWVSMCYVVFELRRSIPEGSSMTDWAIKMIDSYDAYKEDIKNTLRFFSYYESFFSQLRYMIQDRDEPVNPADEWGTTEEMKDQNRANALLTVLVDLVLCEDRMKKRREDYSILIDDAKQMVTHNFGGLSK